MIPKLVSLARGLAGISSELYLVRTERSAYRQTRMMMLAK